MAVEGASRTSGDRRLSLAARFAAGLATIAVALAGIWVFGGLVTDDFRTAMALTAAWFAVAAALALWLAQRRPDLRVPVVGMFLVTALAVGAYLGATTLRDETVSERVVTGRSASAAAAGDGAAAGGGENVTIASGSFTGLAHETEGRAAVVELADGGRKLTLTGFETNSGPDLFVYLVAGGDATNADDSESLGSLKGNKGDQQYEIPASVNLDRYRTVVIWCRAFSVAFGAAKLEPA